MWKRRQKQFTQFTFGLDINLETDSLLASLQDVLTDETASDEFCFIIRLSTQFMLETDNSSLV